MDFWISVILSENIKNFFSIKLIDLNPYDGKITLFNKTKIMTKVVLELKLCITSMTQT
jgi:hypothetical protein